MQKYAGANNPLWIVRRCEDSDKYQNSKQLHSNEKIFSQPKGVRNDGKYELFEISANKQPIGKTDETKPYKTHVIDLEENDVIYIFSDGYVDQFGGKALADR